jgi:ArsR family transcriptional regulator
MGIPVPTNELKLLADPTRARIMSLIMDSADGKQLVGNLATELELRQPTVSHHVKLLLNEGLLQREPDGRSAWYSIASDQADRIAELLKGTQETAMADGVLDRIVSDLAGRFAGTFAPETVDRYVRESHALLAHKARVTRYLPSLTSRFAADRLSALAKNDLPVGSRIPEVLFVCVQNAGRSQLAAGILRHLAGDRVGVRTAGSEPATAVRSVIVTTLDEIGVPIGGEYPKPLTDEVVRAADIVITMGCGDACPVYPGRRYLDWDLEDPVGLPIARVREIRDDIEARVRELLASLEVKTRSTTRAPELAKP